MSESWKNEIRAYAENTEGWFSSYLIPSVKQGDVSAERAAEYLLGEEIGVTQDMARFAARRWFFRGAHVLVRPQAWEVEDGVLVPGHRFAPFYNADLYPSELALKPMRGARLKRKTIVRSQEDAIVLFLLFGGQRLAELLSAEDEVNATVPLIEHPDTLVRLSAYDMSEFYRSTNFRPGDYLRCRLREWDTGLFDCKRMAADELDPADVDRWIGRMEGGFERVYELFGRPSLPTIQLACAYAFAGRGAVTSPGLNVPGLIERSERVNFVHVGTLTTAFWHSELSMDRPLEQPSGEGPTGITDDLESILGDIRSVVAPETIEAAMYYALSRGRGADDALDRCFHNATLAFATDAQRDAFANQLDALWGSVVEKYDPEIDRWVQDVRDSLMEAACRFYTWSRTFEDRGIPADALPPEPVRVISEASGHVEGALGFIVENYGPDLDLEGMEENTGRIVDLMDGLIEQVEEYLEETIPNYRPPSGDDWLPGSTRREQSEPDSPEAGRLRLVPRQDDQAGVVRLKIVLDNIRPAIWRRVQVPADYTLGDLHQVIQRVFTWHDSHLHAFVVDGRPYTDLSVPDEEIDFADEFDVVVGDLETGAQFRYVYDFGDSWEHTVTVESKIADVDEGEPGAPRCLDGARDAPPEDCGGIPGYEALLSALEKADNPEELTEHEAMLAEWAEFYDPEHFDIDEANRALEDLG